MPKPEQRPAEGPGRRALLNQNFVQPLALWEIFTRPSFFWRRALAVSPARLAQSWPVLLLFAAILVPDAVAQKTSGVASRFVFSLLVSCLGLGQAFLVAAAVFAFRSSQEFGTKLGATWRFCFYIWPFFLFPQVLFLVWASLYRPDAGDYFAISTIPMFFSTSLLGWQSRVAFGSSLQRCIVFSILTSVPWYLVLGPVFSVFV